MSQLRESLLPNRIDSLSRDQLAQECFNQLQKIKHSNNALQSNVGQDLDIQAAKAIKQQKHQMQIEIETLKNIIAALEKKSKVASQKTKVKTVKQECHNEIDRYQQIMKELIDSSFQSKFSSSAVSDDTERNNYTHLNDDDYEQPQVIVDNSGTEKQQLMNKQDGISLQEMTPEQIQRSKDIEKQQKQALLQQQIMGGQAQQENKEEEKLQRQKLMEENRDLQYSAQLEAEMQKEKGEEYQKIEKEVYQMHAMMNDINQVVVDGGVVIDKIEDNLSVAKENAVETNKEMLEAQKHQKSRKCIIYIVVSIIILCIIIGLIIYFTST